MGISGLKVTALHGNLVKVRPKAVASKLTSSWVASHPGLADEAAFKGFVALERRRSERSHNPFLLMLLDVKRLLESNGSHEILSEVISGISSSTRETDLMGWYETGGVLGIIFTEIVSAASPGTEPIEAKIEKLLQNRLGSDHAKRVTITIHLFPQPTPSDSSPLPDSRLYPDLAPRGVNRRSSLALKRLLDIALSALLLIFFSPLFAVIAAAIKLGSKGPVLFKQERLGQFHVPFQCFKFRTMYVNNDSTIHQVYARRFVAKNACAAKGEGDKPVYKITNDPRVTAVGRWLRKTSLDEVPQFWNVLRGDMSLVGPRPPLAYEFELYDLWHQRRVFELKPGVTGLWQVSGRSRTNFDEMVRLDLRYHRKWSNWLDIKILLRTPFAMLFGEGAY